jgi:hypothetical protein
MLEVDASMPTGIGQPAAFQPASLDFEYGRPLNVILQLSVGFDCYIHPVSTWKQQELRDPTYTPRAYSGFAGVILAAQIAVEACNRLTVLIVDREDARHPWENAS